jgi:hypothetical protein
VAALEAELAARHCWLGLLSLCLLSAPAVARADEVKDVKRDSHDVKRSVKKAGHRIDEAACTGTKAECATRKGKHRLQEAGDKVGDKLNETRGELEGDAQ